MSVPIIIALISFCILFVMIIGGAISAKAFTTEASFMSVNQTNWIRSIAILMVMMSHYYPLLGLTYSDGVISFCLNFGYMGVAIFFLLSGYSVMISKNNKSNYLKGFLANRLLRLYVPFLIVFILNFFVLLITGKEVKIEDILMFPIMSLPNTLNWYLKIQLGLYILFFIIAKLIKNNIVMIGITSVICISYMIVGFFSGLTAFWYETVFAFPVGMLLANYKERIYQIITKRYYLSLPFSLMVFLACLIPYYLKGGTIFEIVFVFGMLQFIVCLCARIAGNVSNILLAHLGVISLELYLVHIVIINAVIVNLELEKQNLLINIIVFTMFIVVSIFVAKFVSIASKRITRLVLQFAEKNEIRLPK